MKRQDQRDTILSSLWTQRNSYHRGILEYTLEELDFLIEQRQRRVQHPCRSWRDALQWEERVVQHLDVCVTEWELACEVAKESLIEEAPFAASFVLACTMPPSGASVLLDSLCLAIEGGNNEQAIAHGLELSRALWLAPTLEAHLLRGAEPHLAPLLKVLVGWGMVSEKLATVCLNRPSLRTLAVEAIGLQGIIGLRPQLEQLLAQREANAPLLLSLLCLRSKLALRWLRSAEAQAYPWTLRLLGALGDLASLRHRKAELLGANAQRDCPERLATLGFIGAPNVIPELIQALNSELPETSRQVAACALARITGLFPRAENAPVKSPDSSHEYEGEIEGSPEGLSLEARVWEATLEKHRWDLGSSTRTRLGRPWKKGSHLEEIQHPEATNLQRTWVRLERQLGSSIPSKQDNRPLNLRAPLRGQVRL